MEIANIKKSTFYYARKQLMNGVDKDKELKIKILDLFEKSHGQYGYLRITAALRNEGIIVNHKKVERIMRELDLKAVRKSKI